MINLFDEIIKLTGLPYEIAFAQYRYVVLNGNTCYIEQHYGIHTLTDEEIVINLKRGKLELTGKALRIKHLSKGDLVVTGEISGIKHL